MAQVKGRERRWQGALVAGLVALAGTALGACGGAGSQSGPSALSSGEAAAVAKAIALSEAEIARRAQARLATGKAVAYVEALASSFESAGAAIDAAAGQVGLELTPGETNRVIDTYLEARRAWVDTGFGSDAAFLAQLTEDLAWLLDLVDQLPGPLPPWLAELVDQLRALLASYRDLAGDLAREDGIAPIPGTQVVVQPVTPASSPGGAAAGGHPRDGTSWGRGPEREPGTTGANYGTSAYQKK